jgi:peptidoglycan/xylan/chitin deacetylase (PgdA/CDA1 family)
MNRRTFITTSTTAAVGLASNPILTSRAQRKEPRPTPAEGFWPDKARLVISISMQFETGAQPERGASSPFPPLDPKYPDLPVQKWYDYGFKEGIPRLLDLWDRVGVKVSSHMVGQAVEKHPALAKEIVDRGHEATGHGQTWEPQYSMSAEQERAGYQASIDTIQRVTGTRPIGFNAFWLRGTPNTLGILQDLGFIYHIDDISRDEPFTVTVKGKPFAVVPYTIRNNDIVRFDSPATTNATYLQDLKDDFDVLYAEAASRRRMMSVSAHDRISGIPGRVKLLEDFIRYAQKQKGVVFMRKDEIAKWALSAPNVPHES